MVRLYCVTCRSTGKMYVGITTKTVETRWKWHRADACRRPVGKFHFAIQQYGPDDFDVTELFGYPSEVEAKAAEAALVGQLDTFKNGLNSTEGGDFCGRVALPPRTREHSDKVSKALRGRPVIRTPAHEARLREGIARFWSEVRAGSRPNPHIRSSAAV